MAKEKTFRCEVCDKEYYTVVERATCELECAKRVEEEAKKAAEAKKKEEQKKRLAEVDEAYEHYEKLAFQYVRDYGYYTQPWPTKDDIDDNDAPDNEVVDLLGFLSLLM